MVDMNNMPPEPPPKEPSTVKEIPSNPIDFIWDTENMLPKKDAPDLTDHSKTALGATVAKLDENDRITTIGELYFILKPQLHLHPNFFWKPFTEFDKMKTLNFCV